MCSIFGWTGSFSRKEKQRILAAASMRGRDGFGVNCYTDGALTHQHKIPNLDTVPSEVFAAGAVVGQYRATPTTERETTAEVLGPMREWAFTGTCSNDEELWERYGAEEAEMKVDTQAVAALLDSYFPDTSRLHQNHVHHFFSALPEYEGSFSVARYFGPPDDGFLLAANFKPLYWSATGDACGFCSHPDAFPQAEPVLPYTSRVLTQSGLSSGGSFHSTAGTDEVLVSMSGGLDSTTTAYLLDAQGHDVRLVHALYGAKAEGREVEAVEAIAEHGGFDLEFVDLPRVMGGTLTEGDHHGGTPEKAEEGAEQAQDWVSARNLLMLSTMTALAEKRDAGGIAYGGNLEEAGSYPDNEEAFARRFQSVLDYAVEPGRKMRLHTPLIHKMKHEIVNIGLALDVPHELTWSCYSDGDSHCGTCGPCYMRRIAFERNGVEDPCQD